MYNSIFNMTKCSYCKSSKHTIDKCQVDSCIIDSILSTRNITPSFQNMSIPILKRIAIRLGVKTSRTKPKMVSTLQDIWRLLKNESSTTKNENDNNDNRQENIDDNDNERNVDDDDCPICMCKIHKDCNRTTTICKHTFCNECFITLILRKQNHCPICRYDLFQLPNYQPEPEPPYPYQITDDEYNILSSPFYDISYDGVEINYELPSPSPASQSTAQIQREVIIIDNENPQNEGDEGDEGDEGNVVYRIDRRGSTQQWRDNNIRNIYANSFIQS